MSTDVTMVPNCIFDHHLPYLKEAELKVLLVVIRQTRGWIDSKMGQRKTHDRISHSQFIQKTGLSRRSLSDAISSLVDKKLILVTDAFHRRLCSPSERIGYSELVYSCRG